MLTTDQIRATKLDAKARKTSWFHLTVRHPDGRTMDTAGAIQQAQVDSICLALAMPWPAPLAPHEPVPPATLRAQLETDLAEALTAKEECASETSLTCSVCRETTNTVCQDGHKTICLPCWIVAHGDAHARMLRHAEPTRPTTVASVGNDGQEPATTPLVAVSPSAPGNSHDPAPRLETLPLGVAGGGSVGQAGSPVSGPPGAISTPAEAHKGRLVAPCVVCGQGRAKLVVHEDRTKRVHDRCAKLRRIATVKASKKGDPRAIPRPTHEQLGVVPKPEHAPGDLACGTCDGSGYLGDGDEQQECLDCQGSGFARIIQTKEGVA